MIWSGKPWNKNSKGEIRMIKKTFFIWLPFLAGVAPTNALHSALKYLQYTNIFTRAFSTVKWWIIQGVYGVANATSELMNKMLGLSSFVDQLNGPGEIGKLMNMAKQITPMIMALGLTFIAIKIVIDHHAPKIKSVVVQLFLSCMLIANIGSISTWLTKASVETAQGLMGMNSKEVDKGTSALPFNVIKTHTNDLEYMIDTNFKGTSVSSARSQSKPPAKLHWGLNNLTRGEVDSGEVNFTEVLDIAKIKDDSALEKKDHPYKKGDYDKTPGTHFLYGWLKYTADNTPDDNGKGTKWHTSDIWNLLDFSIGGYQRYTIKFLPVLICLLALAFAYIFAGYAIAKAFIDIVLMNILAVIIFSTDLDSGQKTKRAVSSIFSSILLVSLQALELSFYQAACTWANIGISNAWVFTFFMLAATIMLITGNEKVSQFFNVDTGAQKGWRAAGSVAYGAKQLGTMGLAAAKAPAKAKDMVERMENKANTPRSLRRAAENQAKEGARQNAVNQMAGFDKSGNRIEPENGTPPRGPIPQASAAANKVQSKAQTAVEQAERRAGFSNHGNKTEDSPVKRGEEPSPTSNRQRNTNTDKKPDTAGFNEWKRRANSYDKVNRLKPKEDSPYNPVDYNPTTKQPYTYDEWKDDVNNVRTNDVPSENLDGSDFDEKSNSSNIKPVSEYTKKKNSTVKPTAPSPTPKASEPSVDRHRHDKY